MQRIARENVQKVLEEQEKLSYDLEKKKKKIDFWSKELNKREAQTERERAQLDDEKQKVAFVESLQVFFCTLLGTYLTLFLLAVVFFWMS